MEKKKIIQLIEKSGCIWLQITGGEPLFDKDFIDVYKYAIFLGFLIVLSTNGSLITERNIANTLRQYPPYRLTISMYGETKNSYESLTGTPGSFHEFTNGLNWAKEAKIRTRLNIIITKYNQTEVRDMVTLAKNFGFEFHVFSTITPTLDGNSVPLGLMASNCEYARKYKESQQKDDYYVQCTAGKKSFHVNSKGEMSICKTARTPNIDLIGNNAINFRVLAQFSKDLFNSPSACSACEFRKSCHTCPFVLKLYLRGNVVPISVCKKYHKKGGELYGSGIPRY